MTHPSMMTVMTDLALAGGRAIMEIYDKGTVDADTKADNSPVTAADLAADAVICAGLAQHFEHIPIVTEEASASHQQTGLDRFFLVDPLDGTKEFIQRRGDFTVNIALIEGGVPTAGVVYAPAKDRLFRTRDGGDGAWAEELAVHDFLATDDPVRLVLSQPDNAALKVVASKSHRDAQTDAFINQLQVAETKSAGSSLKFCLLAAGEADLYPRFGRTMEWDTAAGHAVLRAAGGTVLDAASRTPLLYGKAGWENPHFLATVPGVVL